MTVRDRIFLYLLEERQRQERKWGVQHHSPEKWAVILGEEVGEVNHAINEEDTNDLRRELIQVAAVAMAWIEDIEYEHNVERVYGEWEWVGRS